ncbi:MULTISPECIES: GyrI-like domain-containing protein [Francisella]|uniref:AraC family transcriptional regulator n=1 Tax=Francisella opportunistica TaxID=2016517 RepID=A0A345JTI1_9GAMM|nr:MULTISPECIES: GyrI-like domain-containing protein [Francisella]APC92425.1 Transcriptional regulator, AraC family [Francisella sp. MA067296]AXH30627.1 AraC family transcriptional regulator [Francisella opportunistica]AXH32267.1 AraC family transcriptional regulator [Francisella opportunistica]AXH33916.1 AraC family transcriptional regulator [Francisella opportunistica]
MKVVGVATKVSNDREDLLEQAWELFFNSEVLEYLNKQNLSQDIISVYYDYEGDHTAPYTLLIGYEVTETFEVPTGLDSVIIELNHEVYRVAGELPDAIIDKWQEVWADNSKKRAYRADFDRYNPINDYAEVNVEYLR